MFIRIFGVYQWPEVIGNVFGLFHNMYDLITLISRSLYRDLHATSSGTCTIFLKLVVMGKEQHSSYGYLNEALKASPAIYSFIRRHLWTAILFTWTDYKTIFLPITAFACATAPLRSFWNLLRGWLWIWIHLLMCNVSNQSRTEREDAINRPWRPIPAGRIHESQARILRWSTVALCMLLSAAYGTDVVMATLGLVMTTVLYDDAGLAWHVVGKNLCNIGGYTTFEIGAMKIMGSNSELDTVSTSAVILSGVLIFTTIQAQDFADVEGDAALGRVTFPIYAPELSRAFTFVATIAWSIALGWYWHIGMFSRIIFTVLGGYVAVLRYLQSLVDIGACFASPCKNGYLVLLMKVRKYQPLCLENDRHSNRSNTSLLVEVARNGWQ
ncbi:Digeranylgeranylglyceryl phosphate synthase [Grifola frondosa]|uniref:Digeranylgeranylglyceryl phosphate synthase n=1 Tax=Grifola frondosa TaxID=5627 RepID=A0A1C7MBQ2_GRIFR|nr:Digeranylgeranylglyceryl phosphate synthase [Grifola frondosa]